MSLTQGGGPSIDGAHLADVETCASCHPDVARMWKTSAHAAASFGNPIYRASIDGFRARIGKAESRFCGGCHDIALVIDGVMKDEISIADPRAHAGVTCRTCHGVTSIQPDGNGSFVLSRAPIPLPKKGDPASVDRHRTAASRARLGANLCVACHRAFLGKVTGNEHHLPGTDDPTAWAGSAYSGNGMSRVDEVTPRDCIECHMRPEPATDKEPAAKRGRIASHRFLGGHTYLAAMRKDPDQLRRTRKFLRGIASIDIAAARDQDGRYTLLADGAPVRAGGNMVLDVVVRNLRVGHRFPGGVLDAQDTWIELTVRDARGAVIAEAGRAHATAERDPSAHVLRAIVADGQGTPLLAREVDRFRAVVVNHTLAARDAIAVRYSFDVPARLTAARLPLTVVARLLHRSRNLTLQRAACRASRTARGRDIARARIRLGRRPLDGCVAQPITELATASAKLGAGASADGRGRAPRWRRLYEHGIALGHSLQERLDEARPSLRAALGAIDQMATPPDGARAAVLTALGYVAGRQGRTDEALDYLSRAQKLAPAAAAVPMLKAAALTRVWRWREAVVPLRAATRLAPGNPAGWVALAVALGSSGDDRAALDAARRGLALLPRQPDLLRVQAMALRSLGAPQATQRAALDGYDTFRRPDHAPRVRIACSTRFPDCERERDPVHVHAMVAPRRRARAQ